MSRVLRGGGRRRLRRRGRRALHARRAGRADRSALRRASLIDLCCATSPVRSIASRAASGGCQRIDLAHIERPMRRLLSLLACSPRLAPPRPRAQELPVGQSEADYRRLARRPSRPCAARCCRSRPGRRRPGSGTCCRPGSCSAPPACGANATAPPFEVPPFRLWPDMVRTLRFVRDHVKAAVGAVEAVSGYRNPALNGCARGVGAQRPSRFLRARPGARCSRSTRRAAVRAALPDARALRRRRPAPASASTPSSASTSTRAASAAGAAPGRGAMRAPARCSSAARIRRRRRCRSWRCPRRRCRVPRRRPSPSRRFGPSPRARQSQPTPTADLPEITRSGDSPRRRSPLSG